LHGPLKRAQLKQRDDFSGLVHLVDGIVHRCDEILNIAAVEGCDERSSQRGQDLTGQLIGFGLALPYLALTLAPAAARWLPAPGRWLPRLREGLGFLAGASTFWLLYALSRQVSPEGLAGIELALLGLALAAWLRAREGAGRTLRLALVLGLVASGAAALWLADLNRLATAAAPTRVSDPELPPAAREPILNKTSGG